MDSRLMQQCDIFIQNRDTIKSVFAWDSGMIHAACAGLCLSDNKTVSADQLKICRDLLKSKVGIFSNFRGNIRDAIVTMMALDSQPEILIDKTLAVYQKMGKEFFKSEYLPLAALIIVQLAPSESDYDRLILRTKDIYQLMKKEHPFLTSSEDCAFCALMALSDKSNDALLRDMEACYTLIKKYFSAGNAAQSLSHVLALLEGDSTQKCQKVFDLYEAFSKAGHRYGRHYELATLGVLIMLDQDPNSLVMEITEADAWLSHQKGFGVLGISKKQRLMYAGMITNSYYASADLMNVTAINSTLTAIIAQQTAVCAAVAASAAASSASN